MSTKGGDRGVRQRSARCLQPAAPRTQGSLSLCMCTMKSAGKEKEPMAFSALPPQMLEELQEDDL